MIPAESPLMFPRQARSRMPYRDTADMMPGSSAGQRGDAHLL